MSKLVPKYTFWDGLNVALTLGMQALEEIRALARIPGPAGKDGANGRDGANGKDGIGIDDIHEEYQDDGRVLVRRFLNGGQIVKEFRHQTKTPLWRGPFDRSREYQPGDLATWGGSLWHADNPIKGQIGGDSGWSLCVKKPRDVKPEDVAKLLADRT